MSITLHLGVTDLPYADKSGKTTGDVAEILEAKYGIVESFVDLYRPEVMGAIEKSLADAMETAMLSGGNGGDPFAEAGSEIEAMFKLALDDGFLDGLPGVPTKAAQRGVSHRFAHPYAKRGPRPSFIDTGLYQQSFKVWAD